MTKNKPKNIFQNKKKGKMRTISHWPITGSDSVVVQFPFINKILTAKSSNSSSSAR